MKFLKNTVLSLLFPAFIFVVMLLITANNQDAYVDGKLIYLSTDLLRQVFTSGSKTAVIALAIWLQLRNGRFDFSGGATMILTGIIAGNIAMSYGNNNPWVLLIVALITSVVLSLFTASVYVWGRLPIIICTIGITLFFESLTYVVFSGSGVRSLYTIPGLSIFGRLPGIFVPTLLAIVLFHLFSNHSIAGIKGKLLSNNQSSAVNIGIKERSNVFITYVFSGLILGLASVIYVSQNIIQPQSGLATAGVLFSNIVPVFIGLFLAKASTDVIGIIIAAFGMEIMYYGLNCINLGGGGWNQIIMGVFMLSFYAFSAQEDKIKRLKDKIMASFSQTITEEV